MSPTEFPSGCHFCSDSARAPWQSCRRQVFYVAGDVGAVSGTSGLAALTASAAIAATRFTIAQARKAYFQPVP